MKDRWDHSSRHLAEVRWDHHLDHQAKDLEVGHHLVHPAKDREEDHQLHHHHRLFQRNLNKLKHLQSIQVASEDVYLDIPMYGYEGLGNSGSTQHLLAEDPYQGIDGMAIDGYTLESA